MKPAFIISALAGTLFITGCTGDPNTNMAIRNAAVGTAVGAGIGQAWGHDSEATATGAIVGGIIGSQVKTAQ